MLDFSDIRWCGVCPFTVYIYKARRNVVPDQSSVRGATHYDLLVRGLLNERTLYIAIILSERIYSHQQYGSRFKHQATRYVAEGRARRCTFRPVRKR